MSTWGEFASRPPEERPLTAAAVKDVLTRAGVDYSALEITERDGGVIITGPAGPRREAALVLFDRGLTCTQYPDDRDEYRRADPRM